MHEREWTEFLHIITELAQRNRSTIMNFTTKTVSVMLSARSVDARHAGGMSVVGAVSNLASVCLAQSAA